jgi:exopolysaccharide biosynthesis polyprenyl glycosylphosphotransferase
MLVLADLVGLTLAFLVTQTVFGTSGSRDTALGVPELAVFVASLPVWIAIAHLYRLYDADEERTHHPTTDDIVGVFHLVTIGTWMFFGALWVTQIAHSQVAHVMTLWALAILFITSARALARAFCRARPAYVQRTVILGAGDVGQRAARKILRHPEYGLRLVGFVDAHPKSRHEELADMPLLGRPADLVEVVGEHGVERVLVAFSNDSDEEMLAAIRSLNEFDVQIDIVPRLFELVTSSVKVDGLEGLPLVELPPVRLPRSSRLLKRSLDVLLSMLGLLLTAPLFAYIALRVRLDSPGPVFFRQVRLGRDQRPFTALKFRTMRTDVDTDAHRAFIAEVMDADAARGSNGLYKLERGDAITRSGSWLRRTSLDELPQLLNVLRGDMSLVGPRPCIPYETEYFEPHHFDRFLVPQGITGLWQVTARARSTFREALDMDVAYARGWSLALDLRLLCRTPWQVLARRGAA